MKKRVSDFQKKQNLIYRVVFLSVLSILLIIYLYQAFLSPTIQFSPEDDTSGLSYENARSLLKDLGRDGIAWYCGAVDSYTDSQGKVYGEKERVELEKVLGNKERLTLEFCEN